MYIYAQRMCTYICIPIGARAPVSTDQQLGQLSRILALFGKAHEFSQLKAWLGCSPWTF